MCGDHGVFRQTAWRSQIDMAAEFTLSYHSDPPVTALENISITVSSEFGLSDFLFADDIIIIINLTDTKNAPNVQRL